MLVTGVMTSFLVDLVDQPVLLDPPFNFNCDISHFRPRHGDQGNNRDSDSYKHERNADYEQCHEETYPFIEL